MSKKLRRNPKNDGKWIQSAIKRPGALKRALGIPENKTIPWETLNEAAKKPGRIGKQARLAKTLRKISKN